MLSLESNNNKAKNQLSSSKKLKGKMIPSDQIKKWKPLPKEEVQAVRDRIAFLQAQHAEDMKLMEEVKRLEKEEKNKLKAAERAVKAEERLKAKLEKERLEDEERAFKGLPPKRRTPKSLKEMNQKELRREMDKNMTYISKIALLIEEQK